MDIAIRVFKQIHDFLPSFIKKEWEDPRYLSSELEKTGFKDCGSEIRQEVMFLPGVEGISEGIKALTKMYEKMMSFEEGEQERWSTLMEKELRQECASKDGLTIQMWANIGWGVKEL